MIHYRLRLFAQGQQGGEAHSRLAEQYAHFGVAYRVQATHHRPVWSRRRRLGRNPTPEFHRLVQLDLARQRSLVVLRPRTTTPKDAAMATTVVAHTPPARLPRQRPLTALPYAAGPVAIQAKPPVRRTQSANGTPTTSAAREGGLPVPIIRHGYANTGNTTERGYGWTHQRKRHQLRAAVASGLTICSRCGQRISPGEPWDLDHTDDRSGYRGPSHSVCNRGNRGVGYDH